jgi:MerR family copper efflux transcriptional regulator
VADGASTTTGSGSGTTNTGSGSGTGPVKAGTKTRMKIGQLARKTGKTVRALHLYEEMGLLSPERSEGGFRLYGSDELARVYWISKLQDMGFKLGQIAGLLEAVSASGSAPEAMQGVRELFQDKLRDTRDQIQKLLQLERDIAESLSYLEACRSCGEQSSKACVECGEERHGGIPEPKLVAGIHLNRQPGDGGTPNDDATP